MGAVRIRSRRTRRCGKREAPTWVRCPEPPDAGGRVEEGSVPRLGDVKRGRTHVGAVSRSAERRGWACEAGIVPRLGGKRVPTWVRCPEPPDAAVREARSAHVGAVSGSAARGGRVKREACVPASRSCESGRTHVGAVSAAVGRGGGVKREAAPTWAVTEARGRPWWCDAGRAPTCGGGGAGGRGTRWWCEAEKRAHVGRSRPRIGGRGAPSIGAGGVERGARRRQGAAGDRPHELDDPRVDRRGDAAALAAADNLTVQEVDRRGALAFDRR